MKMHSILTHLIHVRNHLSKHTYIHNNFVHYTHSSIYTTFTRTFLEDNISINISSEFSLKHGQNWFCMRLFSNRNCEGLMALNSMSETGRKRTTKVDSCARLYEQQ